VALLVAGGGPDAESLARSLQIAVTLGALAITAIAARRLSDPAESLAWAAAASLVILPVTWYHYPSALIPFALAAVIRSLATPSARTTQGLVAVAAAVAAVAIAWLPLMYVAIGVVLAAVRVSARTESPAG